MDDRKTTQLRWDLWNLRAIRPSASPADLERLQAESRRLDRLQERLLRDPDAARQRFAPTARAFFAAHPAMHRGLLLSLHLGPYSLAPVPWLLAGCDVRVLVNRQSHREIAPIYDVMQRRLRLPGRIQWTPITGRSFAVSLARTLRGGGLVLAYLDGNDGYGGLATTLAEGLRFELPGREIRVPHRPWPGWRYAWVARCTAWVTCWNHDDDLTWRRGPSWNWDSATDPDRATLEIFTWGFAQIRQRPEQWRCWSILPSVYDTLGRPDASAPEAAVGADPTRSAAIDAPPPTPDDRRRITWRKPAALWPGDLLEGRHRQLLLRRRRADRPAPGYAAGRTGAHGRSPGRGIRSRLHRPARQAAAGSGFHQPGAGERTPSPGRRLPRTTAAPGPDPGAAARRLESPPCRS